MRDLGLNKRCTVEFSDGAVLYFYGHVEPSDEASEPTVGEQGQITEAANVVKLVIVEDGTMSIDGQAHMPVEPGEYLITEDGLFKRLDP